MLNHVGFHKNVINDLSQSTNLHICFSTTPIHTQLYIPGIRLIWQAYKETVEEAMYGQI